MIVRVCIPTSRKGRKAMKAKTRIGTQARALTAMWGRRGQPGLASISANYRPRG